jgi:hypothetical protein
MTFGSAVTGQRPVKRMTNSPAITATVTIPCRISAGHVVPLVVLALGATFAMAFRFPSARDTTGSGGTLVRRRTFSSARPPLGSSPCPQRCYAYRVRIACYMYISGRTSRAARLIPRALSLPTQQVVLRRTLRLPVRPSGLRYRPLVLEGRRRRDHRRFRAGRRLGARS